MNAYTQNKRHDMFRLSLVGFAFTVLSSPFAVSALARYGYGVERDLLVLGYPMFCTMLSALFLAGSYDRLHQRVKVIVIPTVVFGLLGAAIFDPHSADTAVWSLFFSTIWLSGILRQKAYQDGHRTSAFVFLAHQGLGGLAGLCLFLGGDLGVLLAIGYWFFAVAAYMYLWVDSRYGPNLPMEAVSDSHAL